MKFLNFLFLSIISALLDPDPDSESVSTYLIKSGSESGYSTLPSTPIDFLLEYQAEDVKRIGISTQKKFILFFLFLVFTSVADPDT